MTRPFEVDINVSDEGWVAVVPDLDARIAAVLAALTKVMGFDARHPTMHLSFDFMSDASIQALNAQFRGKDKPTNVLSFPPPPGFDDFLGDIALAREICVAEAQAQGKTPSDHVTHLIAHGILHLLGYDHEQEAEAVEMEGLEIEVLLALGIANPYDDATTEQKR